MTVTPKKIRRHIKKYPQMKHDCRVKEGYGPESFLQKLRRKIQYGILISNENPLHLNFFKSDFLIKQEQVRHLEINRLVVHPYSKFRGIYEIFLIFFYTFTLLIKPLAVFLRTDHFSSSRSYREITIFVDIMCWAEMVMTFFTGFVKRDLETYSIELRMKCIAKHYMLGPYFTCDLLSSIPKGLFYYNSDRKTTPLNHSINATIDILLWLKLARLGHLFSYIYRSAQFLRIQSKTKPFLICAILFTILTCHWAACLQFGVPKIASYYSQERKRKVWYYRAKISKIAIPRQYCHCFLKGSAYILGIWMPLYPIQLPEEYVIGIMTYIIGKFLVIFVWVTLALAILNSKSVDFKFRELMNQIEEYMTRKRLPTSLRERITDFYYYKYQKKYFHERAISRMLPDSIKKDVKLHTCQKMIKNVSLFSDLNNDEVVELVSYLEHEIYLPNEIVIQSGTRGDGMYFLSHGTVAVFSRSGKEICHLQEGAYFGEIALVLPDLTRTTTVVSIETCQVYKLNKKAFTECLTSNRKVLEKLLKVAEIRLKGTAQVEEEYKKAAFEKAFMVTDSVKKK